MSAPVPTPGSIHLLQAPGASPPVGSEHFEPQWWRDRGAVMGEAQGRGAALIVRAPDGAGSWVLRHYRRGGWVARLTPDRYVWTGLEQTRAWREWRLTARLRELGLPVPEPIAARVIRRGRGYTADLITRLIPEAETLAAILRSRSLPAAAWSQLGAMLRRVHEAGVRHDDINVSNILRRTDGSFHMIDFDRAAIVAPGAWRERNLARFHRSLEKHRRLAAGNFAFTSADWDALRTGYDRTPG